MVGGDRVSWASLSMGTIDSAGDTKSTHMEESEKEQAKREKSANRSTSSCTVYLLRSHFDVMPLAVLVTASVLTCVVNTYVC